MSEIIKYLVLTPIIVAFNCIAQIVINDSTPSHMEIFIALCVCDGMIRGKL